MASLSSMSAYTTGFQAISTSQPVASAPASRQAATRAFSGARLEMLGERTIHSVTARAGTMLGFSPASRNTPWMRSSGRVCCRSAATLR